MYLSKKISLSFLFLILVICLNGCSEVSNLFSGNSTEKPEIKTDVGALKQKKEDLERKIIPNLNEEVKNLKTKYDTEQKQCSQMTDDTIEGGRDPEDKTTKTFKQCDTTKKIKKDLDSKKGELDKAEGELDKINQSIKNANNKPIDESSDSDLLTWLLGGVAGLLLLSLVGFLLWSLILSPIRTLRSDVDIINQNIINFNDFQKKSKNSIVQLKETAEVLSREFSQQQTAVSAMKRQTAEENSERQNYQQAQEFVAPVIKEESLFPTSAENYINKIKQNSVTATVDHLTGFLVKDDGKGDEFLLVNDNSLTDGLVYAIPNIFRFSKKGDYLSYYQHFYACDNPTGGTVWINSPTVVQRIPEGWKLYEMGEIEIR